MCIFTFLNRKILSRNQIRAISLLQIGTFLEYFDGMLYVHLVVIHNDVFFPKTDLRTTALMAAFAFCTPYIFRPLGALIFGYIGDSMGRKAMVIISAMMTAVSCLIMAILPTYAQIGITAACIVTLCRVAQGFSSLGEIIGAKIYITEIITTSPFRDQSVSCLVIAGSLGATAALGLTSFLNAVGLSWRIAFMLGAGIAIIGAIARTHLDESTEFVDAKKRAFKEINDSNMNKVSKIFERIKIKSLAQQEKINKKTLLSCFFIYCGWPLSFYLCYMFFNPLLERVYGYLPEDIIFHNLLLSIVILFSEGSGILLCYWFRPLQILKARGAAFFTYMLFLPFLVASSTSYFHIFLLQSLIIIFALSSLPADAIFIRHFPVFKRVTASGFVYALSRTGVFVIISFGLVFISEYFSHWGMYFVTIPCSVAFLWGVKNFKRLEEKIGLSPQNQDGIPNDIALEKMIA